MAGRPRGPAGHGLSTKHPGRKPRVYSTMRIANLQFDQPKPQYIGATRRHLRVAYVQIGRVLGHAPTQGHMAYWGCVALNALPANAHSGTPLQQAVWLAAYNAAGQCMPTTY